MKIAYAKALLIDRKLLEESRYSNDVAYCQEILQNAFRTDVRPLLAESRRRQNAAIDPLNSYRKLQIRETLIDKRGKNTIATGL